MTFEERVERLQRRNRADHLCTPGCWCGADHRASVQRLDDYFVIALAIIAAGWFAWAPSWLSFLGGCAVWLVAFGVWWQGDKEQR